MNHKNKQQGVALITALLISALVTVAAVAMASRQQLDIRRTGNMLEADQAYMYALAGETWVSQMLNEDKKKNQIDTLTEDWALKIPPIPVEGGVITGSVEDMQGRFNLNNLVAAKRGSNTGNNAGNNTGNNAGNNLDNKGKPDQAQIRALQSLLAQVSFAEEKVQLSPFVANRVADWIDSDLDALADGAEDLVYLGLDVPYRAANRLMVSPSELTAVAGLSLRDVAALLPLVTVLPERTAVNVNTAPEMVLLSLHDDITPRIAVELAAMRANTAFETADEFVNKLKDDYDITLDKTLVSVSSDYFLVSSEATIGRTTLRMYSLLERKDNGIRVMSRGIGSY